MLTSGGRGAARAALAAFALALSGSTTT